MKKLKICIASEGWAGYTGVLAGVEFEDGVSVDEIELNRVNRMGSVLSFVDLEGNPVGVAQRLIDMRSMEMSATINAENERAVSEKLAPKVWTKEDLEAVAEKSGIAGIREIATPMGLRSNAVGKLIEMILTFQKRDSEGDDPLAMLIGSSFQPSEFEIDGAKVQLGTVVRDAFARSGLTVSEWNDLASELREKRIADEVAMLKA